MQQLREGRKDPSSTSLHERFVSIRLPRVEESSCIAMLEPLYTRGLKGMDDDGTSTDDGRASVDWFDSLQYAESAHNKRTGVTTLLISK